MTSRGIFSNGPSLAAIDKLMDQLQDAIRNGDNAEAAALQAQIDAVRAQAEQAEETGQNARDMVLRRDTRLNTLEDVANRFTEIIIAAEATHQALRNEIDTIALTPGPAGKDGTNGTNGRDGADGKPGIKGDTGPAGPVNLQIEYRDGIAVPAVLSLLGSAATVDITITWPNPFPDTNYLPTVQCTPLDASLVGRTAAAVKSKTATGVVATVTTTALLAAGKCMVSAVAYRKG